MEDAVKDTYKTGAVTRSQPRRILKIKGNVRPL